MVLILVTCIACFSADNFFTRLGIADNSELPAQGIPVLDAFCKLLQKKLTFSTGERDMVFMNHQFLVEYPSNERVRCGFLKVNSSLLMIRRRSTHLPWSYMVNRTDTRLWLAQSVSLSRLPPP